MDQIVWKDEDVKIHNLELEISSTKYSIFVIFIFGLLLSAMSISCYAHSEWILFSIILIIVLIDLFILFQMIKSIIKETKNLRELLVLKVLSK